MMNSPRDTPLSDYAIRGNGVPIVNVAAIDSDVMTGGSDIAHRGPRVRGARVDGMLDLARARAPFETTSDSWIEGWLDHARARSRFGEINR